jgi:hypothetical protein
VAKTWSSDANEMDGREGVRYFHAVGRPLPSITEMKIEGNWWPVASHPPTPKGWLSR